MRLSKLLIPFLIMATAVACSSLFKNNDDNGPTLTMQTSRVSGQTTTFNGDTLIFEKLGYGKDPKKFPSFTFHTNDRQIVIDGYYLAADGFTPAGQLNKNENNIIINIDRAPDNQFSPSAPLGYLYHAFISSLSQGNYKIKIVHKNDYLRTIEEDHKDTVFTKEFVIK